ncbi:hypothetical protein IE81DRAFT_233711 [Ceraceosorus guamensis]|uniref:Methyltransferase domain-containing protein n=1 Tax=Ceraceosorus guamensis TaxID=1522189 RepID=A0A316VTD2_9BASI|nr:hypothetical protein IE81DRAFT_233711 [Ceraceosorus guamensis]PWN40298.1 hypothetical protein IE81DRAFT_233711 [Ceraceosorus guamensis]
MSTSSTNQNDDKHLEYLLAGAPTEAERLNLQQKIFTALFPGREYIHTAPFDLSRVHRVLDVATGTGIWLERLWKEGQDGQKLRADVELQGCDIDLSKVTTHQTSKDLQITYIQHNVLQEFPAHMHNQYDLVQMRFVLLAMNTVQYAQAIRNLRRLLREGGTLQLVELDPLPNPPTNSVERTMKEICEGLWSRTDKDPTGICLNMLDHVTSNGFLEEKVNTFTHPWPFASPSGFEASLHRDVLLKSSQNYLMVVQALKQAVLHYAQTDPIAGMSTAQAWDSFFEQATKHFASSGYAGSLYIAIAVK